MKKDLWRYSVRSDDLHNKTYLAMYRDHGQLIIDNEPFKRRGDAEAKGAKLQAEAQEAMRQEAAAIKAELAAAELAASQESELDPLEGEVVS